MFTYFYSNNIFFSFIIKKSYIQVLLSTRVYTNIITNIIRKY